MNNFAETNRHASPTRLDQLAHSFESVIVWAEELFGVQAFRLETATKVGGSVKKFNAAYFDAVAVGIHEWQATLRGDVPKSFKSSVKKGLARLLGSEAFMKNILRATSDEAAVRGRIGAFADMLKNS